MTLTSKNARLKTPMAVIRQRAAQNRNVPKTPDLVSEKVANVRPVKCPKGQKRSCVKSFPSSQMYCSQSQSSVTGSCKTCCRSSTTPRSSDSSCYSCCCSGSSTPTEEVSQRTDWSSLTRLQFSAKKSKRTRKHHEHYLDRDADMETSDISFASVAEKSIPSESDVSLPWSDKVREKVSDKYSRKKDKKRESNLESNAITSILEEKTTSDEPMISSNSQQEEQFLTSSSASMLQVTSSSPALLCPKKEKEEFSKESVETEKLEDVVKDRQNDKREEEKDKELKEKVEVPKRSGEAGEVLEASEGKDTPEKESKVTEDTATRAPTTVHVSEFGTGSMETQWPSASHPITRATAFPTPEIPRPSVARTSPEAATQEILKDLLSLREALRLGPPEAPLLLPSPPTGGSESPVLGGGLGSGLGTTLGPGLGSGLGAGMDVLSGLGDASPRRSSSAMSSRSSSSRFRQPASRHRRNVEKMDAQFTSYLVRLLEEQIMNGGPRGGRPNPPPVRLRLPQFERRPLPPLAVALYCEGERLLVRREYEAAFILFARGAAMHPDSPRFQAGILKAKRAIERDVDSASRILLGTKPLKDAGAGGAGVAGDARMRQGGRRAPHSNASYAPAPELTTKGMNNPAAIAALAAASSSIGKRRLYDRVLRLGELGRSVGRLRGGSEDQSETVERPITASGKDSRGDVLPGRTEPLYTVPLEGSGELLMGTIADIAKFMRRREEYWKRLPGPAHVHVPAVANLRDPKSAPLLYKRGTAPPAGAANRGRSPTNTSATATSGNLSKEATQDKAEKRWRAQLAQMEEWVRERRFGDALALGGQLLRALEARRPGPGTGPGAGARAADRDAMMITAQNYVTISHIERGELEAAARISERMLRRARGLSDQRLLASALATAGRLRAAAGQLGWAAACWEQMVPLVQDDETRAWLFHELGRCSFQLHELQTARKYGEWSLSAARRAGSARWALNAALLSAQTEMQDGRYAAAHTFLEEARPFCAQLQDAAAAAYIRDAERLILTDRLPTVVVDAKNKREAASSGKNASNRASRSFTSRERAAAPAAKGHEPARPPRSPEMSGAGEGGCKSPLSLPPRGAATPTPAAVAASAATPATTPTAAAAAGRVSRRAATATAATAPASPVASPRRRSASDAP